MVPTRRVLLRGAAVCSSRRIVSVASCRRASSLPRTALLRTTSRPVVDWSLQKRKFLSATRPLYEKRTIVVPTMGDSITEGTIVEWTAQVGQAVKTDDVVALVETDKVTVEIKAEMDGVVTQHFGAIDDTVEVGAALYEIDTEAEASVSESDTTAVESSAETRPPIEEKVDKPPLDDTTPMAPEIGHRQPSIHFLGKEGWAQLLKGVEPTTAPSQTTTTSTTVVHETAIHPMYGRPQFTQEEMDALVYGGANLAPRVVVRSSGAKFSHK